MNKKATVRRMLIALSVTGAALVSVFLTSCIKHSGGAWMVDSAPLPEGWPELTPVGEVAIRRYPVYRAAKVENSDAARTHDDSTEEMFMELFGHIKKNSIPMTAPVDMEYERTQSGGSMKAMAFLYRVSDAGPLGQDGPVAVLDVPPRTFASVGVRGDYTEENFRKALGILDGWLGKNSSEWIARGAPRYLGYNGPFTPSFLRYGEVQIPVEASSKELP
jgi:hypothetical protein